MNLRMFWFHGLWFLTVLADDDCAPEVAASWIQMKLQYDLNDQSDEGYYWVKRGGDLATTSAINWSVPDVTESPAWVWPNKDDEQVRHSPLIDDKLNIYLSTTKIIRKFDRLGQLQWTFKLDEKAVTSPTLHHGKIYILSGCGSDSGKMYLYALHMENGKIDWNVTLEGQCMGEASSILAVNEMLILPYRTKLTNGEEDGLNTLGGGANGVRAVSLNNGTHLWDYVTDQLMWNFAPSTPGDGTLIFSSCCGAVFRISLEKGETIWKTEAPNGIKNTFCGTGGGALGPNGIFYSEFNTHHFLASEEKRGMVAAHNVTDGAKLWERKMEKGYDGIQYPAVGKLGPKGKLSVVVGVGQNTNVPLPLDGEKLEQYLHDSDFREDLKVPHFLNRVMALDALTGETLWTYEEPVWNHFGAAGDEEGFVRRIVEMRGEGPICLPDAQGIPVINQLDGTVFFSSSHAGNLTAIRDANHDGFISDDEVKSFATHNCFLNSPSMAPNMMVAAPCWGPVYVFLK